MMRALEVIRRAAKVIRRPWPVRGDRQAAVRAARQEKEHSLAGAGRAAEVEQQIRLLVRDNHFAEAIADQIISSYRRERGGK
jgi:hypothetical protein